MQAVTWQITLIIFKLYICHIASFLDSFTVGIFITVLIASIYAISGCRTTSVKFSSFCLRSVHMLRAAQSVRSCLAALFKMYFRYCSGHFNDCCKSFGLCMAATTPAPIGLEPGPAKFFPIEVVDEKVGGGVETDQKMGHPGIHKKGNHKGRPS